MTLNRRVLKRVHSPLKSPKRNNTSLRKKALIKQWSNEVQFGSASKANLKVVVRVRPQNQREQDCNARCIVKLVDDHMMVFDPKEEDEEFFFRGVRQRTRDLNKRQHKEQKFVFEHVFGVDSTNEQIYEETTKDLVDTLLNGYNCSVFAYGATGAGKTFTMLGKPECPGITFLTLMELYRRIEEIKEEKTCEVGISYLEVYNETVRDLLKPGKALNVQETGQHVQVQGLSFHKPKDADDLMQMLACGNQNRSQHPTDANAESSRSHAVFQIFVRQQDRTANVKSNVAIAKLSMIDLAGSERGSATGFRGARFREGANINKSLLALGNCINALADGQKHIPYRDSKLTRLLKDSIGGNCRSVMIAAISPASTTFEDTFNTLRYANRAKTIKTTLKKNIMNVDQHVSQYVQIVEDLRKEICCLKEKLQSYEEKEKEWTSMKEISESRHQDSDLLLEQQNEYESRIASLENEIKELKADRGVVVTEVSEEEADVQRKLVEASSERKALRRELLQLESSQREVELKIHTCTMRLNRMKIIAFASQRLDKSISKCERTIRNLNIRLSQTKRLQQSVESKLNSNLEKLHAAQRALNQWGPGSNQPSHASQMLIDKNESGLAYRDLHQLADYLRGMVKESFNEQSASEQLICQLLNTTKQFYVQLRASNQCTPEMEKYFESIVEKMDESKIIWADQHQENKEESTSLPEEPVLDVNRLTILPITSSVFISPATMVDQKMFRRSIMKSSKSTSALPSATLSNAEPSGLNLSTVAESFVHDSPTTPRILNFQNTIPDSPVLSGFSLPSEDNKLRPEGQQSEDCNPLSHSTVVQQIPEKFESVETKSQTKDFGFVSMTEGCGINTLNVTRNVLSGANLDKTELLEDIQPIDCSINATFAITPAKSLNTTIDMPKCLPSLNTTMDVPGSLPTLNTTIDMSSNVAGLNTTVNLPARNITVEKSTLGTLSTAANMSTVHSLLNTTVEVSKPSLLATSVGSGSYPSLKKSASRPNLNTTINFSSQLSLLNTTVDMTTKPSCLNTTVDLTTKPSCLNTTVDMTTKPSCLNTTVDMTSKTSLPNTTIDLTSNPTLNTTMDLVSKPSYRSTSSEVSNPAHTVTDVVCKTLLEGKSHKQADSSISSTESTTKPVISLKVEEPTVQSSMHDQNAIDKVKPFGETYAKLPITNLPNDAISLPEPVTLKTASRKLFESGLDSTFCVEETQDKKDKVEIMPGCSVDSLKSPEVSSNQLRRMTFEVQQQGPLIKPVEVQPASEMLMPPPTKAVKGILKKTPQKTPTRGTTPGKGTLVGRSFGKTTTPGKNITPGRSQISGMKKSLSTSALGPYQSNSLRTSGQSVANNKQKLAGLGAALRRTSSFLKARGQSSNQENVPPSSQRSVYRDTLSSSAKQLSHFQYKP
ncbi:kinesin-related protein 13-like [Penaeus japonicus]|uniref:kinesin-related protein 13-like n=1 Tax=Penaeus japonicus TaxID=27405 RepID=UPI001C7109DF|nr:kinesin-related protein 13-like [Penaeus japonicus]